MGTTLIIENVCDVPAYRKFHFFYSVQLDRCLVEDAVFIGFKNQVFTQLLTIDEVYQCVETSVPAHVWGYLDKDKLLSVQNISQCPLSQSTISSTYTKESATYITEVNNENTVSILTGVLPGFSTFITFSTLIHSPNLYVTVLPGLFLGGVNAYALYYNEKRPGSITRFILVFLEAISMLCMSYDAIQTLHPSVSASLPDPFNQCSTLGKSVCGIALAASAIIFTIIALKLEQLSKTTTVKQSQLGLTIFMVFISTYPLILDFLSALNGNQLNIGIYISAVSIAILSSLCQGVLINQHSEEDEDNNSTVEISKEEKDKSTSVLLFEYFGKLFMASEIILSLANTAFSNHSSSMGDFIKIFHATPLSNHICSIGLGLFIVSIIIFLHVSFKHFELYSYLNCCSHDDMDDETLDSEVMGFQTWLNL